MPRVRKTEHGPAVDLEGRNHDEPAEAIFVGKGRRSYLWVGHKDGPSFATSKGPLINFLWQALELATGKMVVLK